MNFFHAFTMTFLLFQFYLEANPLPDSSQIKLNSQKSIVLDDTYEISGLIHLKDKWLTVLDDEHESYIYQITQIKKTTKSTLKPFLNLKELNGYREYEQLIVSEKLKRGPKYKLWDLEGIASCSNSIYLVNERFRHLLKVDLSTKSLINLSPYLNKSLSLKKFKHYRESYFQGGPNAGFEGVTVDCANNLAYISKERSPRFIIEYDLKQNVILNIFNLPASPENRSDFNKNSIKGKVGEDFADLAFYQNHLYALERNNFIILKINPKSKQIVSRLSFAGPNFSYIHFANTNEPFGMAEALFIKDGQIYVGFDINQNKLNEKADKLVNLPLNNTKSNIILSFDLPQD